MQRERISVVERVQCELISDDCGNSKTAGYPEAEQTAGRKIYDHADLDFTEYGAAEITENIAENSIENNADINAADSVENKRGKS